MIGFAKVYEINFSFQYSSSKINKTLIKSNCSSGTSMGLVAPSVRIYVFMVDKQAQASVISNRIFRGEGDSLEGASMIYLYFRIRIEFSAIRPQFPNRVEISSFLEGRKS